MNDFIKRLEPGDIILFRLSGKRDNVYPNFWTNSKANHYTSVSHAALYIGNGEIIQECTTVASRDNLYNYCYKKKKWAYNFTFKITHKDGSKESRTVLIDRRPVFAIRLLSPEEMRWLIVP